MKIIIAEDQGLLRGAISRLLGMEADIDVVGEAGNGKKALALIQEANPDIAVLDIEMPYYSGLEVAEHLQNINHPCKVAIVTTFARTGYLQKAIQAGVQGYLLKETPVADLAEALRQIHQGQRIFSPQLTFSSLKEHNPLTEREIEIIQCLQAGESVREISQTLFLSQGTIRNYISEIMQKLEAKNRIDAVAIAEEKGWLS
ncbi:response regulator transcription factor [Thalassobacillus pellis]|uniref:response regulator transcription factor n=1 Tax=Thalassobacillus pellis TaxID=748008 RepID=UPI0019609447|nr:response regulator transcription factor [Thalassobacillus pellis]MBM7554510.1 DNA-binding NarL/FixJ family response regulator [Thalassobacillus pellis]